MLSGHALWTLIQPLVWRVHLLASDHPIVLEPRTQNMSELIRRLASVSPTGWCSDSPTLRRIIRSFWVFLISFLRLYNLSQRSFGHSKYILSLHFHCDLSVSTVVWTSRRWIGHLDDKVDVSDMVWTLSNGPKESYKYDLANSRNGLNGVMFVTDVKFIAIEDAE